MICGTRAVFAVAWPCVLLILVLVTDELFSKCLVSMVLRLPISEKTLLVRGHRFFFSHIKIYMSGYIPIK